MNSISVKELRQKLPFVRSELKKGTSFLIIFKSKPIAKLSPIDDLSDLEEAADEEIEFAVISDFDDGEDFLSKDELNYYLSLKDLR
jgi:antitoxin (DNA-binding transcriptional repressor) of toxin-antitoxin stability system